LNQSCVSIKDETLLSRHLQLLKEFRKRLRKTCFNCKDQIAKDLVEKNGSQSQTTEKQKNNIFFSIEKKKYSSDISDIIELGSHEVVPMKELFVNFSSKV
jgi:hypothetical protein